MARRGQASTAASHVAGGGSSSSGEIVMEARGPQDMARYAIGFLLVTIISMTGTIAPIIQPIRGMDLASLEKQLQRKRKSHIK